MGTSPADRRVAGDRRARCSCLRYPERRHGFDRRRPSTGYLRRAYWQAITAYRGDAQKIVLVLATVLVLSLADLLLTLRALDRGAVELNPIMAHLIGIDPVLAGVFKLATAFLVVSAIWILRRYRRVLEVSVVIAGGLALLLVYHVIGTLNG
jgi:hypothetical protein